MNQLLTEMDGIGAKKNLFIIGATNRPDILDEALLRPGRLDQLIYIPLPDKPSRSSIINAILRKSPIAPDVHLDYLAQLTDGFSGADITEMCQRSAKSAIRDSISHEEEKKALLLENPEAEQDLMQQDSDAVPFITRKHFEEGLSSARKSVSATDQMRFEQFRKKFDPVYAARTGAGTQFANIQWPDTNSNAFNTNVEEDDLYN